MISVALIIFFNALVSPTSHQSILALRLASGPVTAPDLLLLDSFWIVVHFAPATFSAVPIPLATVLPTQKWVLIANRIQSMFFMMTFYGITWVIF